MPHRKHAAQSLRLWDAANGEELLAIGTDVDVKRVALSSSMGPGVHVDATTLTS